MYYDIIGDIHGHADELKILLQKLGYQRTSEGVFNQLDRQVIYVGDFIDRGTQNIEVLSIVKSMVEHRHALAVMGNHEFNAICFHTLHPETGLPLREYNVEYGDGHLTFLKEMKGKEQLLTEVIDWFQTLPFFLDLEGLRVIHARWNFDYIEQLKVLGGSDSQFIADNDFIRNASIKYSPEYHIIETLLKGAEIELPESCIFKVEDINLQEEIDVEWWEPEARSYPATEKPVFFGHYWMLPDTPLQGINMMCVDHSVSRNGVLCSYRWSGEEQLQVKNILTVSSS